MSYIYLEMDMTGMSPRIANLYEVAIKKIGMDNKYDFDERVAIKMDSNTTLDEAVKQTVIEMFK
jgi:hypothetical protein